MRSQPRSMIRDGQASPTSARKLSPFPAVASQAAGYALCNAHRGRAGKGARRRISSQSAEDLNIESVREAVVAALGSGRAQFRRATARARRVEAGRHDVRVSVPGMGKKMLSLTVNAAAEKIIRQELQRLGAPSAFSWLSPARGRLQPRSRRRAPAGSVQEAALAHPLVQRAQEIFKAEVRSVVDLRQK